MTGAVALNLGQEFGVNGAAAHARKLGYFLSHGNRKSQETSNSQSRDYIGKILLMERDAITMTVARNLEALIEARGTNPSEVARRAQINPTGVYDILSGKSRSPKIETLGKIAKALGVPVATLFEDQPDAALRGEIVSLFSQLPPVERERLVLTAKAWLGGSTPA